MLNKLVLFASIIAALSTAANGSIVATLTAPTETGNPGDTLTFKVSLTNTSTTDQIWLNGVGATASSPALSIDTSLFNTNAPFFLDPLAVSTPFDVFQVTIDPSAAPGPYLGSFVSIQGGPDGGAGTAFDDLADISFDVIVDASTGTATPEPATLGIAAAGLIGLLAAKGRARYSQR